jgi:hypothetical protein
MKDFVNNLISSKEDATLTFNKQKQCKHFLSLPTILSLHCMFLCCFNIPTLFLSSLLFFFFSFMQNYLLNKRRNRGDMVFQAAEGMTLSCHYFLNVALVSFDQPT